MQVSKMYVIIRQEGVSVTPNDLHLFQAFNTLCHNSLILVYLIRLSTRLRKKLSFVLDERGQYVAPFPMFQVGLAASVFG